MQHSRCSDSPPAPLLGRLFDEIRDGRFTERSGHTYKEVLETVYRRLSQVGDRIDFLEVDFPYDYYKERERLESNVPIDNRKSLLAVQKWCEDHDVRFHLIVNAAPQRRATSVHDLTLEYVRRRKQDGVFPDVFIIQSWFSAPSRFLPETRKDTFMGSARSAIQLVQDLYPSTWVRDPPAPDDTVCANTLGGVEVIRPDASPNGTLIRIVQNSLDGSYVIQGFDPRPSSPRM